MQVLFPTARRSLLMVISGPAGSGKTTLCDQLLAEFGPGLQRVVTATSRPPRAGEVDRQDYYFLSDDEFERRIAAGDFYEHALVHSRRYGVLREAVMDKLNASIDLLMNIDVQGAATFREATGRDPLLLGRLCSVFIMPRNMEQLRERLDCRGSDDPAEIERRLNTAQREVREWHNFDYCILSGSREDDYAKVRSIYLAETLKASRREER